MRFRDIVRDIDGPDEVPKDDDGLLFRPRSGDLLRLLHLNLFNERADDLRRKLRNLRILASVLDSRDDIKLFLKLPPWYLIDTPVGAYNSDWAIVKQSDDDAPRLVLIRETKGTTDERNLRKSEVAKIHCGKEHFSLLNVDYKVIVSANDV